LWLQRVQSAEPRHGRDVFGELRVVLHRARAEWIETEVDAVVTLRQACVVADEIPLGHLGQRRRLLTRELFGDRVGRRRRDVERWHGERAPAGPRELE